MDEDRRIARGEDSLYALFGVVRVIPGASYREGSDRACQKLQKSLVIPYYGNWHKLPNIAYLLEAVSLAFPLYHFSNIGLKSTSLTHPLRP
jgi:hypothetical protein